MRAPGVRIRLAGAFSILCACGQGSSAPAPELRGALGGTDVARVGQVSLPKSLVARVASSQRVAPAEAVTLLVRDALLAQGATRNGLDRSPETAWAVDSALARSVVTRIRDEAHAAGPPTDDEVRTLSERHWQEVDLPESVRVVHAVVLRPKGAKPSPDLDAKARSLAEALRANLLDATNDADFKARARAFPHEGFDVKVEQLEPFVADGRITTPGWTSSYDTTFAAAGIALTSPGSTSSVVETPFGWHVIRLIERLPGRHVPFEERRAAFAEETYQMRGGRALAALLETLHKSTSIDVANGSEALEREATDLFRSDSEPGAGGRASPPAP